MKIFYIPQKYNVITNSDMWGSHNPNSSKYYTFITNKYQNHIEGYDEEKDLA